MPKVLGELRALLNNNHTNLFFRRRRTPGVTSLGTLHSRLILLGHYFELTYASADQLIEIVLPLTWNLIVMLLH
jgi:hypothetical protein